MRKITITGSASLYVCALLLGGTSFAALFYFDRTPGIVAAAVVGMLGAVAICGFALQSFVRSLHANLDT